VTLGSIPAPNFTAYGVRREDGGFNVVLINNDTRISVEATIDLGGEAKACEAIILTGPSLESTEGYTLGGAEIKPDGTWAGLFKSMELSPKGILTVTVPPISAIMLRIAVRHP
jgi:hypothetical protein